MDQYIKTDVKVTLPPEGSVNVVPTPESRAAYLNQKGAEHFARGEMEPARFHFLATLQIDPNHVQALQNLGAVLRNMGHHAAAESVARRSVDLAPDNAFCRSNLGVAQLSNKKFQEAASTLANVLKMLPESGPSWHNYGLMMYMMNRHAEALAAFNKSLALSPPDAINPHLISDKALTLMQLQRVQEGLELYECRWNILGKSPVWNAGIREWKGEDVVGRHVLLHHEQGFGDGIMLIRFLPRLVAMQCRVTVAVPMELHRLFELSFGDMATFIPLAEDVAQPERFDYHVPMLSLLRYIGLNKTSEISDAPYLFAPKNAWVPSFVSGSYKIGIVWASGDHGPALMERRRLAPICDFLPMTELRNTTVVSLQKGAQVGDIARHGLEGIIYDASVHLQDFADTAALILKLDVVVSVDSAVAHLAGALGVPCLMLSPYTRCWRWWGQKNGAPWYRNMSIFYQKQSGSWSEAIAEATRAVRLRQMGVK